MNRERKSNYTRPGITISYDITGNRPYIEKNPDSVLLKNLKEAIEAETKQKAVVKAFIGYTDTAVIAGKLHNTECMSYGPVSLQYAHKPDEFVEIRDIIRCEKVINHLVMSLCGEK
ncbi:M20/M25/M40 family metallo-hydrolase [Anaerobutyricum soehngenii]|nr:M20/M25/M40 family metallo-hydrolase [Anaerobutyricum soehngenii]